MNRITMTCGLILVAAAVAGPALAQQPGETETRVPELSAFHEIIYPMWHTAWPARDTTMLRELWPDIQKHVAAIGQAELPGILRDKQEVWKLGLQRLEAAARAYGAALEGGTADDKLAAAEEMHSAFEGLVRAIRPVMPELAQFHAVLYRIYHYHLPNKDREALLEAMPELTAEMDTLKSAALPTRLADHRKKFDRARANLAREVRKVAKAVPNADWPATEKSIEAMHSAYQAVEKVFD